MIKNESLTRIVVQGLANFLHTLLDDEDARRALHRIQRALFDVERDAIAAYQG